MLEQRLTALEALRAELTAMRSLTCVAVAVLRQQVLPRKLATAHVTTERLRVTVRQQVLRQASLARVALGTEVTRVASLAGVRFQVTPDVRFHHSLPTNLTLCLRFYTFMNALDVGY